MAAPLLAVRGLTKAFAGRAVLAGVDLDVHQGTIAAVLGPSGTGKTTLLRIVAGFEDADAGTVTLDGVTLVDGPRGVPAERRHIGIVPQEGALFPHLSVGENVGFGLRRRSHARIEECLELVGLAGMARRRPHELSGGQQQRVALARALAPAPPLVVLDEPFSSLDAGLRAHVRDDVMDALRRAGATALLVTHDQQEALAVADQVAVLLDGTVAQAGPPETVYRRPASLAVATFVGESIVVPVAPDGSSTLGPLEAADGAAGSMAVVRPEQVRLTTAGAVGTAPATVTGTTFLGHEAQVTLRLADGTDVRARLHLAGLPAVGAVVGVAVVGPVSVFGPVAARLTA
jgi:iron(III) transport system ATP-binding protein